MLKESLGCKNPMQRLIAMLLDHLYQILEVFP